MKTLTLLLSGLCIALTIQAQENLVLYSDINHFSAFEKRVLDDHFLHKKSDLFLLFMSNGNLLKEADIDGARTRFYAHLDKMSLENVKKNEKKVKLVYDNIHKAFLNKYELKNRFEDIFYNGYFNCVSASALYGLAFDHFGIPFSIKEEPTHVYLIAYPDTERIIVETTSPVNGFSIIDPQFKHNFVKVLKDQKLISAQEYTAGNVDALFDKFYFGGQENITLPQLVGIQYFNDGLYQLEQEKHLEAISQMEKAYLFYPSRRMAYMIMSVTHEAFKKREARDSIHAACLSRLSRYKKYGITPEMIQGEFVRVVEDLLRNKGENEKLKAYYTQLQNSLQDDELRQEISFIYHYENGRILYNQARFKESIPFFQECLKIKPKHQETNNIFIGCIAQSVKNRSNAEALQALEQYTVQFPLLLQNNIFNEMLGSAYLMEIETTFESGRPAEGEKYKGIFENFYREHNEVTYNTYLIGRAYSAAAVYYFKKGQSSKARTVITKGLELSPNNYELITRKRMIE
jgi:tetratricopeptide (TPR) repeat protein